MRVERRNAVGVATLISMVVLMLFSFHEVFGNGLSLPRTTLINLYLDAFGIIICTIVFASTLLDQHINPSTVIFMCILTIEELLLFWNIESWIADGDPGLIHLVKISNYYTYGFQDVIIVAYWIYLKELYSDKRSSLKKMNTAIYVLFTLGMLLILTNPWTGFMFSVDPDTAVYERGPYYYLCYLSPYLSLVVCLACIHRYEHILRRKIALLIYIIVPFIGAAIQAVWPEISLQVVFMMFAIMFMYTNIYIERSAELIANETKMTEQRASVMVSQIQPHFMYNALTSIMNIKGNPMDTKDAIADFGKYMRGNLDSITQVNPIPINREMDQLESYINLRKIKYGDRIDIRVDLRDTGFFIPPMVVKTIVGAAIDCRTRNDDFYVLCTISSASDAKNHILVIRDEYPSEDVFRFLEDSSSEDIHATAHRLETMVRGTIRNEIGKDGSLSTIITIPRSQGEHR